MKRFSRGFTLIELMIVVAVLAVILMLAAPSFYNLFMLQRLKAVSAQLNTDVQYARSEAIQRNQFVRVRFGSNASSSCYAIYTGTSAFSCNCLNTPVCGANGTEIRTVRLDAAQGISLSAPAGSFRIEPTNGVITVVPIGIYGGGGTSFEIDVGIDTARSLRTVVNLAGRPAVCRPTGSTLDASPC